MKTYLSVLLRNTIKINTIFQTELKFFSVFKNVKPEFNAINNSFYKFKLSNDLIRYFVNYYSLFLFPNSKQLLYVTNNGFGYKDEINGFFKRSTSLNSLY